MFDFSSNQTDSPSLKHPSRRYNNSLVCLETIEIFGENCILSLCWMILPDCKTQISSLSRELLSLTFLELLFSVFSFEPNPKFQKRHQELKRVYEAMGWRYLPFHAGVSNKDGNFTFYHSHMKDKEQELGFSAGWFVSYWLCCCFVVIFINRNEFFFSHSCS